MNKGLIIGVVVVLILGILGVGGYLVLNNSQKSPSGVTTTTETNTSMTAGTGSGSIKELITSQSPMTCSFNDSSSQSTGVVYIANGDLRGDFSTTNAQGSTNSHMILQNNTIYGWVDGETTGFQMAFDANAQMEAVDSINTLDINKQVDYSCAAWTVDQAMFTLPTGVEFTNYSSLMMQGDTDTKAAQCAACDQAPASAQAACKAALGC